MPRVYQRNPHATARRKWLETHGLALYPHRVEVHPKHMEYDLVNIKQPWSPFSMPERQAVCEKQAEVQIEFRFMDGLIDVIKRYETVWPDSRFVTYEESDEEWALPLGAATVRSAGAPLMCGDIVRISDYVRGMTGEAFVDDVYGKSLHREASIFMEVKFFNPDKPLVWESE